MTRRYICTASNTVLSYSRESVLKTYDLLDYLLLYRKAYIVVIHVVENLVQNNEISEFQKETSSFWSLAHYIS